MNDVTIEQIELELETAREFAKKGDALERLLANADFNAIISEGYFKEHAYQLVELKAAPSRKGEAEQAAIIKSIDGIGELQQYFNAIRAMADNARAAIDQGNAAIDEITGGAI